MTHQWRNLGSGSGLTISSPFQRHLEPIAQPLRDESFKVSVDHPKGCWWISWWWMSVWMSASRHRAELRLGAVVLQGSTVGTWSCSVLPVEDCVEHCDMFSIPSPWAL